MKLFQNFGLSSFCHFQGKSVTRFLRFETSKKLLIRLTYLLTPWCRVLLEKLTGLQLIKKFPAFHGTRRFITALTSVRQLSLSWASPIQSIHPHPTFWRSILILSTHLCLGLPSGLFPSGFPTKTLYTPSPHPYAPHAQSISFFSILSSAQFWVIRLHVLISFLILFSPRVHTYIRHPYQPKQKTLFCGERKRASSLKIKD